MQINPSTNGWIEKFLNQYATEVSDYTTDESFFLACQKSGLIYGYVVNYHLETELEDSKWDAEEKMKVGFLATLFALYKTKKIADSQLFIEDLFQFYTKISKGNFSFLNMVLPHANNYQKLESIINERLQTNDILLPKISHIWLPIPCYI